MTHARRFAASVSLFLALIVGAPVLYAQEIVPTELPAAAVEGEVSTAPQDEAAVQLELNEDQAAIAEESIGEGDSALAEAAESVREDAVEAANTEDAATGGTLLILLLGIGAVLAVGVMTGFRQMYRPPTDPEPEV